MRRFLGLPPFFRLFLVGPWEGLFFLRSWTGWRAGCFPVTKCRVWGLGPFEVRRYDSRRAAVSMRNYWKGDPQ